MNIVRFIFLGFAIAFFGCASTGPAKVSSNQQLEAVACDPQYEAEQILAQKKMIPAEVFHFSRKETLLQDLKDHHLSEKSWESSLTGGDPGSGPRKVRRGLYVSDGIDTHISAGTFFGEKNNWLVQFSLTDECREPKKMATLLGLENDPRFLTWFQKINPNFREGFLNIKEFAETCHARESLTIDGYTDLRCEKIVLRFFEDAKISVVQDHQASKNFYLRDFNCIEGLRGHPEDMIQILVSQDFWAASCSIEHLSDYTPYLLGISLSEISKPLSKADYESLFQNVGLLRSESVRLEMAKMLNGYQQCVQSGKFMAFKKSVSDLNLKLSNGDNFQWISKECSGD